MVVLLLCPPGHPCATALHAGGKGQGQSARRAKIDQCLAAGHGLIVWTAHLGNSEFASRLLEMHGRPVNVARVVEDKPAEIMLRNLMVERTAQNCRSQRRRARHPRTVAGLASKRNRGDPGRPRLPASQCRSPFFLRTRRLSAGPLRPFAGFGRAGAARLCDSPGLAALPRSDGRSDPAGLLLAPHPMPAMPTRKPVCAKRSGFWKKPWQPITISG